MQLSLSLITLSLTLSPSVSLSVYLSLSPPFVVFSSCRFSSLLSVSLSFSLSLLHTMNVHSQCTFNLLIWHQQCVWCIAISLRVHISSSRCIHFNHSSLHSSSFLNDVRSRTCRVPARSSWQRSSCTMCSSWKPMYVWTSIAHWMYTQCTLNMLSISWLPSNFHPAIFLKNLKETCPKYEIQAVLDRCSANGWKWGYILLNECTITSSALVSLAISSNVHLLKLLMLCDQYCVRFSIHLDSW